MGELLFTF